MSMETPERMTVIGVMESGVAYTPLELAGIVKKSRGSVQRLLRKLTLTGAVVRTAYGAYVITERARYSVNRQEVPIEPSTHIVGELRDLDWPGLPIICPICGGEYVHAESANLIISGERWGGAWEERGSAVRIGMRCEKGHAWVIQFGFRKGRGWQSIIGAYAHEEEASK